MCPVSIDDAETAFDYQPEVSGSSSFVYGVEQFKESLKESVPQVGGVVGGLLHKAGKEIDKYFPDGIKLFNGSVDVKIADKLKKGGEILVNAADRNVEAMQREFRRNNPRLEKAQENLMFDIGNQGANWTTMLLTGRYAGHVMGNLVLGGEFQERADKYKQEHGGSLEGFAQEYGDEAGYNLANAFVQGVEERYLGSFAQVKSIKKGMGFVKAIGKNAVQEGFIEEPLQDVTDFYFDKLTGFNENEELKDRLKGNLRGYVVASLFGGAGGFGAAVYQRAEGIDYYKEALKNTVPEKDLEKVATKAYEQDAKTLREIVTVEIENSSSLENKRGEVYENMYKSAIDSVNRARKQGGYADLRTEEEVAAYAKAEADNFANWVLEEANRRNTTIQNVLDASSIYSDETGLHIGMTKVVEQVENVETFEPVAERKTELAYEDIIHQLNTREMSEEEEERLQDMLDEERDRLKPLFDTALDAEIEIEEEFDLVSELTDLSDSMTENKMSYEEAKRKLPDLPEEQFEKLGDKIKEKEGIQGDSAKIGYEYFTDRVFDKYNERMARSKNYRLLQESLELAHEMERLDDLYPEYEGETITINGQEKTVYNSNGDRIAMSEPALRNFYKWFGDSKVVDEQGRPLVVYHGSDSNFEVFDRTKTRSTMDIQGNFFSPWELDAQGYGQNVRAFYLSIKNPAPSNVGYKTLKKFQGQNDSGIKAREELENMGYDGVNNDDEEYIAFNPNQIKSTSNRGTYSESENIYYQSAFAGSRVDYDRPSLEAIGSGEGNQAHGWGLYYALNRDVAEGYRERFINEYGEGIVEFNGVVYKNTDDYAHFLLNLKQTKKGEIARQREIAKFFNENGNIELAKKHEKLAEEGENINVDDIKTLGQVHEVDIPENPYLLDEQKTFAEQSDFVKQQLMIVWDNLVIDDAKIVNLTGSKTNPYKNVARYKTGNEIYKDLANILGSDKAASELLEKYGIKGITYDGKQDGRCFVIFNPDDVKVIQKFYQRGKSTRGSIQFKGQEAIIRLTDSANASTLAHELAHYYLQNTFLYSKSGLASPEYSTYFKPIADYLGIDSNQETIKDWQQEKFARAYEQYLLKGKAETPELQAAFNNYNKWIKRAYRMLKSKPKYRNEEGKLVEPRLTPEIMEAFGKLTGGFVARPDIEAMAETVTPELENAVVEYENQVTQEQERIQKETVYPTTEIRETAEDGTTGKSGVAFRVLGEELGYDVKHIDEQMDKARDFVRKNLSEAREIVNGKQAPEGILSSAINLAYVEIMENSGNYQEAERATRLRSMEQTRRGQEIAMEKATTDNILNAETWSNLVLSRKSAEAARKYFKNDLKALQDFIKKESANIAKQIVNKPKEERAAIIKENLERITKETGILFQEDYSDLEDSDYYNEVLNETQLMIEKSMGIGLDEDQIDYIHDNVRQLQDIVKETVSNNGNISIEAFKQIRKMYDTIESYTPSSNVAVWSSIIGRGAMLASIKSPILNIISNAENMITETLSRKALNIVTGQSNDNIVDSNIVNDYLKWSYNVYQASGYMPSVTSDILGGRPILGEKRLTSQGQGKVRAIGRFAEDIVFKELMGLPDSISKDLNFVSVAGNKATQQAYKEGLSGDKAKARANELFKDAILLRPMTEEGDIIRNESMKAAHEATFTQDSEISKIALRIRDVLNSKEFKAGDFLVPFVKTPANVVALGMEYSLGSIYTVYHIKDIINNPQSDISQAAIKAGVRNGIGMILAMMLAGLVDDDDYIPEYDNASPKQRDIAKLKNAPFNSIRIGNKWINLDYFGPLAIPMAGILTARAKQDLTGFLQGVSGQALKTPGVKEINSLIGDVTRAVQYGVSYKKIAEDVFNWGVEQTASRTIPAIFTDFGKLIDKYERETGGEMVRRVMAKIPVLREELPIKTDITGRKIETETTNILFGSRVKTAVDDAVVKEIDRLNKAGNAPTISDPTRYGKFRSLETEEKDKIRTKFNQEYGRKAREKIASSAYKRLDDAQKKKELNKIRKKISDDLKKQK